MVVGKLLQGGKLMVKESRSPFIKLTENMLNQLPSYQQHLQKYLNKKQILTLEILVWLLQAHKQVTIERLAAYLPLPILYESRRRYLQRFLILRNFSVALIWLPIVKIFISNNLKKGSRLLVIIDGTKWHNYHLLMVSVRYKNRAIPICWKFLDKIGSSNLNEQIAVLRPALKLLNSYQIIVVGDREFRGVKLAYWLKSRGVKFALRVQGNTHIKWNGHQEQKISTLEVKPGMKKLYSHVNYTKKKGFGTFNLAAYWKRKYGGIQEKQPWYILTNLDTLEQVLKAYRGRSSIEAMFRDCKSGGYNLSSSKASEQRLSRLVLLIALAYVSSVKIGTKLKYQGLQQYISRRSEPRRIIKRHSNFWVGLYGQSWILPWEYCEQLVTQLMSLSPHKFPLYQRGLRAMSLIQST